MLKIESQNKPLQQPGMNGLFSWLKKAVNTVLYVVGSVTSPSGIANMIQDFTNADGLFGGQGWGNVFGDTDYGFFQRTNGNIDATFFDDFPLSPQEEATLDTWLQVNFLPYFNELIDNLNQASGIQIILALNKCQTFLEVTERFILQTETNGQTNYTTNMIKARNEFLKFQNAALKQAISDIKAEKGIVATMGSQLKNINPYDWGTRPGYLFTSKAFTIEGQIYKSVSTGVFDGNNNGTDNGTIEDQPIKEVITTQPTTKADNTKWWLLGGGLTLFGLLAFAGRKKDKKRVKTSA